MVYVIKDTVDIYCFYKNYARTPGLQAAFGLFETNRKVPTFFFQNPRKFL